MKVPGGIVLVLALAIAVLPQFYNCLHDGKQLTLTDGRQIPMKCDWTAQAEIAVGAPLVLVGGLLALSRRKESRRGLAVLGATLGVFATLLPTSLIGVCAHPDASCNLIMRPAMLFLGALVIATSLGALVFAERSPELAKRRLSA